MARKNTQPPQPARPEQVRRLKKAMQDVHDAILFDGGAEYQRAEAVLDAVWRNSTPTERDTAAPGIRNHKKGGR
jgi:hypothetical protein